MDDQTVRNKNRRIKETEPIIETAKLLSEVAGVKKSRSIVEWLFVLVVLFASAGFYLSSAPKIIQEWLNLRVGSDLIVIIIIILSLYLLKTVALTLPIFFLYSLAGVFLDPVTAILVSYAGLTLEMSVSYLIGYSLGRNRVQNLLKKRNLNLQMLTAGDRRSFVACALIRMIPGPPIDLVTYLYGATRMKYIHCWLSTLLGLTPSLIPIVLMGVSWQEPLSVAFLIPLSIAVGVSILSLIVFRHLGKKPAGRA